MSKTLQTPQPQLKTDPQRHAEKAWQAPDLDVIPLTEATKSGPLTPNPEGGVCRPS